MNPQPRLDDLVDNGVVQGRFFFPSGLEDEFDRGRLGLRGLPDELHAALVDVVEGGHHIDDGGADVYFAEDGEDLHPAHLGGTQERLDLHIGVEVGNAFEIIAQLTPRGGAAVALQGEDAGLEVEVKGRTFGDALVFAEVDRGDLAGEIGTESGRGHGDAHEVTEVTVVGEAAAGETDPVVVDLDIALRTVSRSAVEIAQDGFESGRFDIDRVEVNFGGFLHKRGPLTASRERVNFFANFASMSATFRKRHKKSTSSVEPPLAKRHKTFQYFP